MRPDGAHSHIGAVRPSLDEPATGAAGNSQGKASVVPVPRASLDYLGGLLWLLMNSRVHSRYTIEELKVLFLIPIEMGQAALFRDGPRPIGFVSWAWLSDEVAERYIRTTHPIGPEDWTSGRNLWFMDFITPFGHSREIIRHLREVRFPDQTARSLRFDPPRRFRGIRCWRGVHVPPDGHR